MNLRNVLYKIAFTGELGILKLIARLDFKSYLPKVYNEYLIIVAAMLNYEHVVKFFIKYCNANVDTQYFYEEEVERHLEKMKLKSPEEGATALFYAAKNGNLKLVQYLLRYSANMNLSTTNSGTPICIACENGNLSIVTTLLSKGAKLNTYNSRNEKPIDIALRKNHYALIALLKRYNNLKYF